MSYNEISKIGNRKKGRIEYKKAEIVALFCKHNESLTFLWRKNTCAIFIWCGKNCHQQTSFPVEEKKSKTRLEEEEIRVSSRLPVSPIAIKKKNKGYQKMYINFQKKIYVEKFLIFFKIISRGNKEGAGSVKFYNIHEEKRILNMHYSILYL